MSLKIIALNKMIVIITMIIPVYILHITFVFNSAFFTDTHSTISLKFHHFNL